MRYLGLDLGTKTLGVSISDLTKTIASTYKTIRHDENYDLLVDELKEIIKEKQVTKLILGFPKNMNNTIGEKGELTIKFKELLEDNLRLPVILEDERLTTVLAQNMLIQQDVSRKKRKKVVDTIAATIILQGYLDREGK